jgi:hypothetical protein
MLGELYIYNLKKPGTFGVRTELCSTHKTETVPGKPGRMRFTYIQGGKGGRHFLPKIFAILYVCKLQLLIVTVEKAYDLTRLLLLRLELRKSHYYYYYYY